MKAWECKTCGWTFYESREYPELSIRKGSSPEDLPEDFKCPLCGGDKENFRDASQPVTKR